jgi:spermidine/putrescine transport system ATP-binding protein
MSEKSVLLSFNNVSKRFDSADILVDFNLDIYDGEFFTILGPSGCGKTTVLRLIAGFERSNDGIITIDGKAINDIPAEQRPVNTVFQSYALFPHMNVEQNVAFGLKMTGVAKAEIHQRVTEALELVKLSGFEKRSPSQLSGGQKQRVAIARAIVMRPRLLLLDESLSALDHKLRQQMQMELKQMQRRLGITFVYVTHDQEEALSMSDRILVMSNGQAQQIGTPREIYEQPTNLFIARFIGEINVFDGSVIEKVSEFCYLVDIGGVSKKVRCDQRLQENEQVHVMVRPEDLRIEYLEDKPQGRSGFMGVVVERSYTGQTLDSLIDLGEGWMIQSSEFFNEDDPDFDYSIRQKVWVDWVEGWEHVIKKSAI